MKVYLEDTDAQGIVYHASYVRFMERGRSDFFDSLDASAADLARAGIRLVVHELRLTYRRAARLGERLEVVTEARLASPFRIVFEQRVERPPEARPLCEGEIHTACIDDSGRLVRIPERIATLLTDAPGQPAAP